MKFLLPFLFALSASASLPSPVYFSLSGGGNGSSPSSCLSEPFVNDNADNWGSGSGQISPTGTTLVIVGVVGEVLTPQNMSSVTFSNNDSTCGISSTNIGINIASGAQNITINLNGGFIASGNNGSLPLGTQIAVQGVQAIGVTGLTVENGFITNLYVHSSLTDSNLAPDAQYGVTVGGASGTILISNIYFSNVQTCVYGYGSCNLQMLNCQCYNDNHGIYHDANWCTISGCHFGVCSNWMTSANPPVYHNDGIHVSAGDTRAYQAILNCTFDQPWGTETSGFLYDQGNPPLTNIIGGNFFHGYAGNSYDNYALFNGGCLCIVTNNTFMGSGDTTDQAVVATTLQGGEYGSVIFQNNLMVSANGLICTQGNCAQDVLHPPSGNVFRNNIYIPTVNTGSWTWDGSPFTSFSQWTNAASESGSLYYTSAAAIVDTNTGLLLPGSIAAAAGYQGGYVGFTNNLAVYTPVTYLHIKGK